MNGVAQVIGCLLMYGIGKNKSLTIAPWRVLFIICGALTVAAGIGFFLLMPSGPKNAWFLNEREKKVLTLRLAAEREGGDKTTFSFSQFKETILDAKAWMVFWFGVLVTMQSPVLTFASLVIESIGYSKLDTMLYTAPSGAVQVALLWIGTVLVMIFPRQRNLVVLALIIPPLIGTVFLMKLDVSAKWGLIVAAWVVSSPLSSCSKMMGFNKYRLLASRHQCQSSSPSSPPTSREIPSAPWSTPCFSLVIAPGALVLPSSGPTNHAIRRASSRRS